MKGEAGKADRLFRAATSAFCSLTRPSRRDIVQLEDLALPLFNLVSVEARRYMAAALSDCQSPPPALVRRLCDETIDIAAPLLILAITGAPVRQTVPTDLLAMAIAGLLVGFGTVMGSGCTSGHGVCGLARLSPRSLVAVLTFMATAFVTVLVLRHIV